MQNLASLRCAETLGLGCKRIPMDLTDCNLVKFRQSGKVYDLYTVLGNNLCDEVRLVDYESCPELHNTSAHRCNTFFEGHILSKVVVQNWVNKVTSVPVSSFLHLLQSAEVVHPIKFCLFFDEIVATDQNVCLVRRFSQRDCHFRSDELCSRLDIRFVPRAVLKELEVAHDEVGKLVAVSLLSWAWHNLELVQLHNFVIVVF